MSSQASPPGKPSQNAYIERFNRSYCDEVLDVYLFDTVDQVRKVSYGSLTTYNERRSHESLGGILPTQFRE